MKPTQAQPPLTMREVLEHIAICPDGCSVCRTMAKDALTAAAEVGEQAHLVSEIHRQHKEIERLKVQVIERDSAIAGWIKRTAAAEVGSPDKERADRLRLELEKIAWMDEFLDADGARAMMNIAREAINNDS